MWDLHVGYLSCRDPYWGGAGPSVQVFTKGTARIIKERGLNTVPNCLSTSPESRSRFLTLSPKKKEK